MNIVELFLFLLGVVLSVLIGNYFVSRAGWWGIFPAVILGFGLVVILIVGLNWLAFRRRPPDGCN